MRIRTSKQDGFSLAGKLIPVGSLYVNEPRMLTAYVCDFTLYVGAKSGNMYIKGFMFDDGKWHKAVFFETGTIFIDGAKFGGRFPEIFYDFSKKFPYANKAIPSKLVGIVENAPSTPRSRIADITPMHGTAYSLKKHNADNADRWTFGGKFTSIGTDTPVYAATGKTTAVCAKTKRKDYGDKKTNYVPREASSAPVKKRSEYLDQFNEEDWASVIFRDSMFALRDEMCR